MSKVKFYENKDGSIKQAWIECPGCGNMHAFTIQAPEGPVWGFNNDINNPTFTPSLLCNSFDEKSRCHSFVTNGKIQFLSDCWHELKNQTVDLPEIDF